MRYLCISITIYYTLHITHYTFGSRSAPRVCVCARAKHAMAEHQNARHWVNIFPSIHTHVYGAVCVFVAILITLIYLGVK